MQDHTAAITAATAQLKHQLVAVEADNAAARAYCTRVSAYSRQLAEFESAAREQLPALQRLLGDLDAAAMHVLQGEQITEARGDVNCSSRLHLAAEAAADLCCSAALSSQSPVLLLFQSRKISLQQ
jgi:hypothetical protein